MLGPGVLPGTLTLPSLSDLLIFWSPPGKEAQPKLFLPCSRCPLHHAEVSTGGTCRSHGTPCCGRVGRHQLQPVPGREVGGQKEPSWARSPEPETPPSGHRARADARHHSTLPLELGVPGGCPISPRVMPLSESSPNYARLLGVGSFPEIEVGREHE